MMRWVALLALGTAITPLAGLAEDLDGTKNPNGAFLRQAPGAPNQIRTVTYSPTKRIEVTGIVGQPTTFCFPSNETVYRVVQTSKPGPDGELTDAGWHAPKPEQTEKTPLGNILTLWPAHPGYTTMTIITMSQELNQKPYAFRLIATNDIDGGAIDPNVTLNLMFPGCHSRRSAPTQTASADTVPSDPPPAKRSRRRSSEAAEKEREAGVARIRVDAFNSDGTCHYTARGPKDSPIIPRCPLDNGQWTLMRFPGLSQKPAVYIMAGNQLCGADDGSHERWPRQHGSGDFVVIEEIAPHFCLRLGTNVIQIDNLTWDPAGHPTGTGTPSPGVDREIIKASK